MIPEWFVISCAIIVICAFCLGIIVGVKIGIDVSYWKGDDDYHV